MPSYQELKAQAEVIFQQAEEARQKEVAEVIHDIKEKMTLYGISLRDLGLASKSRKATGIKYRCPKTGETWTGRGRKPIWFSREMAKGRTPEEFLVG